MQQELMFDVIAYSLAQPVAPLCEVNGAAPIGNSGAVRQARDLLLQLGLTHRIHDPSRVDALLREHFDLMGIDLPAGSVDGDRYFQLIAAHEKLAECRLRSGHLATAECGSRPVALVVYV
jgi:hypothetical protein